jgi:tetratricopeptide (TPR) repeat protein
MKPPTTNQEPSNQKRTPETAPCFLRDLTEREQQALEQIVESFAGASEEEFDSKFRELVMSVGEAVHAGKDEDAKEAALTMLLMAGAKALKDPGEEVTLANEASWCEEAGDWAGAEAAHRKRLALHERSPCSVTAAKAWFDLSRLSRLLGRLEEAWSYARAATAAARREDLAPLTVMMLENEIHCALERKDVSHALAAAEEAVRCVKPERMQNLLRMRMLILRAECLLENADVVGAERDLKSAGELESDLVFSRVGGAITVRAQWQEIHAELLLGRGNLIEALNHLTRAVALRREAAGGCCSQSPYALVARVRGLQRLAEISAELGNHEAGREALRQAEALREQARLPLASVAVRQSAR